MKKENNVKVTNEQARAIVAKAKARAMKTGRRTAISGDQFRAMFAALDKPKPVPILDMTYDEWEACGDDGADERAKAMAVAAEELDDRVWPDRDYRGPDDEVKPFTVGGEPTSHYDMSDQQAAEFMNEGKRRAR